LAADRVVRPVAVQYAFHADAQGANLYNDAGLPASPSRTDDWPLEPPGLAEKDSGRVLINHRNRALPVVGTGALSAFLLGLAPLSSAAAQSAPRAGGTDMDSPAYWKSHQEALAGIGDGYIVWESRRLAGTGGRAGEWSIWTANLDGSGLRQLAPDEPERNQTSPHISPDGTRVVYLSFPAQSGEHMDARGQAVPLHMVNRDGSADRIIVADARQYSGWDRAVTWFSDSELAYIGGDGNTYQLNLTTGESQLMIRKMHPDSPSWLPNITRTHAAWSFNTFSLYDAGTQTVAEMPHLGGCQPYFCQDGVWGFWEGGIGGPINKMHLATRAISPILDGDMMPPERRFVYFPMISDRNRLLAFAATDRVVGGYGGYVESDYEIYVAPLDATTLDVIGKPVRYTFDPRCDRFPDVWQAEPALGFHSGKVPFRVAFTSPEPMDGFWHWDYGDGAVAEAGAAPEHTYTQPGVFAVTARQGERTLRGQVRAAEATTPAAVAAMVESPGEILVAFDQPVDLSELEVALASGAAIARCDGGDDRRSLRLHLAAPLAAADRLTVSGATDLAQRPNRMRPASFAVQPRPWPSNRDGAAFIWENAKARNLVRDPQTGGLSAYALPLRDRAWLDHNYALVFDGGNTAIPGFGDRFSNAVRQAGQYTFEMTLTPASLGRERRQCILSSGLSQQGDKLVLENTPLCTLQADQPNHVVITRTSGPDGRLVCHRNGEETFSEARAADLNGFRFQWVSIGNDLDDHPWFGTLEGIALYSRALSAAEAKANWAGYCAVIAARTPVSRLDVDAKLLAASPTPSLHDIQPYSQALAVYEYEIVRVHAGPATSGRVRVAHWVLLDGQIQSVAQSPPGSEARLLLEPLGANPQLEEEFTRDTLDPEFDLPLFFAVSARRPFTGAAEWSVLSLPDGASRDLDAAQDIEGAADIRRSYPLQDGQAWRVAAADAGGFVSLFSATGGGCGYALAYVRSPEARKARIAVRAYGGAKAWLNGRNILTVSDFGRYPFAAGQEAEASLAKGWNELLVKITQKHAFMSFRGEVLGADGREMTDLTYAVAPGE